MPAIRALTALLPDPSRAARSLSTVFGWSVESDFGTFAALQLPGDVPLWINAPADGEPATGNLVLHLTADDVDESFREAVACGARAVRQPQDMDYGERSASVTVDDAPGLVFDFSRPLT
ncbi:MULTISPECIES: VOC family protein [unclassified Brachybacterium]|uniref:VOC family protein n=1 Tax=unclassified Brachybacterium TaxID=2623841 RepID=UPI0036223099